MEEEVGLRENLLFGIGDSLLVMVANVEDEFLAKYGLKRDDQILADEKHSNLYDELAAKYNVTYYPGGAIYSTLLIAQWMLNTPVKVSTYFGCIGKDKYGDMIKRNAESSNIDARFYEVDNLRTGICASCITGKNRSIVTELGAGRRYSKEKHLDLPENWKFVEEAEYYYLCCYFLNTSPNSVLRVGKYAAETNKPFLFSLSAPYLAKVHKLLLIDLLKYTDYIFCNYKEALAYAEAFDCSSDNLEEVAKWMRELPKVNTKRERVVVVTCNKYATIVATVEGVTKHPVIPVDEDEIVDTTSAGDAFAGGFLSQLIQGKSLEDCIAAGHYAASIAIKGYGVTLPEKPEFIQTSHKDSVIN